MAKKDAPSKKAIQKEMRDKIQQKLHAALAEFEPGIGKKKYDSQLKKMSKMLASEIRFSKNGMPGDEDQKVKVTKSKKKKKNEKPAEG